MSVDISFKKTRYVRWHLLRLVQSAMGGAAIAFLLLVVTFLAPPQQVNIETAFDAFRKSTLTADLRLFLPTLFLGLLGYGLSGFRWARHFVAYVVRPALRFCVDFCATALGGVIVWWVWIVFPTIQKALFFLGIGLASVFGVWAMFALGLHFTKQLPSGARNSGWGRLATAVLIAVTFGVLLGSSPGELFWG